MSVDVTVTHPQCCEAHNFQFTYNYSPALREAGFPAWKFLDGLPADIAAILVGRLLSELTVSGVSRQSNPREHYEPLIKGEGTWGTWEHLLESLRELLAALDKHHINGTIHIS